MEQAFQSFSPRPPGGSQPAWHSAIERHRAGDTDGAIVLYQRHLKRNPQDAPGWMNLGAALRRTGRCDAALVCYQRALRLRPDDAAVWSNLGNLWKELEQHEQSLRSHRRALQLDPSRPQLRVNFAISLREAGRFEEAEQIIEQCLEHEPRRADLLCERALLRLHLGRYREAWPDYEARWLTGQQLLPAQTSARWQGERIGGKRVLLLAEQGPSQTLWAARFVSMLARRGAELDLCCDEALHPVLRELPVRLAASGECARPGAVHDFHCPLLSLPGVVDPRGVAIPEPVAISVSEESRVLMRRRIAPYASSFRVGLVWSGNGDDERADLPFGRLLPLAALPGLQLLSLQQGGAAAEQHRTGAAGFVADLGSHCRHFGDIAAALEQMDLVVAADSTVAHLAGSMGKPVLGLMQYKPHWIFGMQGDSTPWYPSVRVLRQRTPGDWGGVCAEVLGLVGRWAEIRANRRP